ncbi:MAG: hypothetical protein NTX19_02220 [Gemmatimonadetes bacterium]|nr:hypothetical protein [Gemmatimonadota bacterium]
MSLHTRLLVLGTVLAVALPAVAAAQATDGQMGTWAMNVAKSSSSTGKVGKSETRIFSAVPNGYTMARAWIDADGNAHASSGTVLYDGKFHAGSANGDSAKATRVDANTTKAQNWDGTLRKMGNTCTRVVSAGGKTLTNTCTDTDAAGKPTKSVHVYDKK